MYHPMSADAGHDREFILKHAEQLIRECEGSVAEWGRRVEEAVAAVSVCAFMEKDAQRRLELYRSVVSSASSVADAPPHSPPAPAHPVSSQ
jgi:hypothetical protein